MSAASEPIALVSLDTSSRGALAQYLRDAGFEVHEHDELAIPKSYSALILLAEKDLPGDMLRAHVRTWIELARARRVIVVTARPAALKELRLRHGTRLAVLAAPAFGWEVVDLLRSEPAEDPTGA
jgi:hypothetical protein